MKRAAGIDVLFSIMKRILLGVFVSLLKILRGSPWGCGLAAAASGGGDELFCIITCEAGRDFMSLKFILRESPY